MTQNWRSPAESLTKYIQSANLQAILRSNIFAKRLIFAAMLFAFNLLGNTMGRDQDENKLSVDEIIDRLNKNAPNLIILTFWDSEFGNNEIRDICETLKSNTYLQQLNFYYTNLSEQEIYLIADMLRTNKYLRQLTINDDWGLNENGALAICSSLKENNRLTRLWLKAHDTDYRNILESLYISQEPRYLNVLTSFYHLFNSGHNNTLELVNYFEYRPNNDVSNILSDEVLNNDLDRFLRNNRRANRYKNSFILILLANNADIGSSFFVIPKEVLLIIATIFMQVPEDSNSTITGFFSLSSLAKRLWSILDKKPAP